MKDGTGVMHHRIGPLDGLRAVAVTGVIWVHVWSFFGNIPLLLAGADWNKTIAFAGVGVDLFFVISGFCMYLMYRRGREKDGTVSPLRKYGRFLLKRWKRIAPAFYAAVLFESLLYLWNYGIFPLPSFAAHLFFLNTFLRNNVLSPPFWSLATEWQFYLLLPFVFFKRRRTGKANETTAGSGKGSLATILLLTGLSLLCRMALYRYHQANLRLGVTVMSEEIIYRFPEFGWGMLAARFYLSGRELPGWLSGLKGFLLSMAVAAAGRMLMVTGLFNLFGRWAFLVRSFGEPVMTLGFALLVLNLIQSRSVFSVILSSRPMLFLGRISYSMYLWHWLVIAHLCRWWLARYGISNGNMQLCFISGLVLVTAAGWLSWYLFERPYFTRLRLP